MWTLFWDMNSGGGRKEPYDKIYIEAPEKEAISIFYDRFGHNPNRVTCTCCGSDYVIYGDEPSLEEASSFHRKGRSVEDYVTDDNVLVLYEADLKGYNRFIDPPEEGYVWL